VETARRRRVCFRAAISPQQSAIIQVKGKSNGILATDEHSAAGPQPKHNIHHGDTESQSYTENKESVEKQSQKQMQNQNTRTAEKTEKVQGEWKSMKIFAKK